MFQELAGRKLAKYIELLAPVVADAVGWWVVWCVQELVAQPAQLPAAVVDGLEGVL